MHSSETTNQFIELRSQNISLERIAKQLGIHKSTAVDWQSRYQAQINELKAIHLEAIRERLTTRYEEELEYAMTELKRIRAELKTRDFDYEPTAFLHHAEAAAYRRVQKLCALADFPTAASPSTKTQSHNADATPPSTCNADPQSAVPQVSDLPSIVVAPHPESRIQNPESKIENPSKIHPFPHQDIQGSHSAAPATSELSNVTEVPLEMQSAPCSADLRSAGARVDSSGLVTCERSSAPAESREAECDGNRTSQTWQVSDLPDSQTQNPESKIENPSKIHPFPHQSSESPTSETQKPQSNTQNPVEEDTRPWWERETPRR